MKNDTGAALPVSVSNLPATQAVSGTVSVGNLPATQPVSGTVSVDNLPATQNVAGSVSSADTTVTLASEFGVPITSAQQLLFTNLDVSAYRTVRIYISCGGSDTNCGNTTINLGDFTDCICQLDSFALGGFNATRMYETISQKVRLYVTNGAPGATAISYKVVGRRN